MIRVRRIVLYMLPLAIFTTAPGHAMDNSIAPLKEFQYTGPAGQSDAVVRINPLEENRLTTQSNTLSLSLFDAIQYALEGNRNIEVAAYYPQQAEQDFKRVAATYDPFFFAEGTTQEVDRPTQSQLDTGSILDSALEEDRSFAQMGIKTLFPTGTSVSLFQELNYLNSNSTLIFPNPQATTRLAVQLRQPLLKGFGDPKNRTTIETARLNISVLNEEFKRNVADVIANVAVVYWQLVLDRQQIRIAERYLDMTEDLQKRERSRLKRGLAKELDLHRVVANLNRRQSELILLDKRARATEKQLLNLLNAPELFAADRGLSLIPTELPKFAKLTIDRAAAEATALANRAELKRAQEELKIAELMKKQAKSEKLPQLDLEASYSANYLEDKAWPAVEGTYDSHYNSWMVGLKFEIPIGNRAANAQYSSSNFEYKRRGSELKQVRENVLYEVNQAITDLEMARDEVAATQVAELTARRVLEGENALFELAKSDSADLLQAQNQVDLAERSLAQSIVEFNRSKIVFERAKGVLLENLGIRFQ